MGMYRRSLLLLWTGVALFAALAVIDAMVDFMGHLQGLFIGATAACFVGAIFRIGLHELNDTATINREKAEQVHGDVDELRTQVDRLQDKVAEVRDLTEAGGIIRDLQKKRAAEPESEPERDAVIYQFRIHTDDGAEVIAGNRSHEHVAADEILAVLAENDVGTMPGRFSAS